MPNLLYTHYKQGLARSFPARLLLLLLLLTSLQYANAAQENNEVELTIRPSICVSYDSNEPCTMMLLISWRGGNGEEICLNTQGQDELITCWDNALSGEIEEPYENINNVVYQLISMQNGQVLAQAEVRVISRDLRDSRRRRRHVWSIL